MRDHRSAEAAAYRKLYKTKRWRCIRADQLVTEPLCRMCMASGLIVPATVVNHITPHRGDMVRFWSGPFESLCKPHHDSIAQRRDILGYLPGSDAAGRPVDPGHPWNRPTAP